MRQLFTRVWNIDARAALLLVVAISFVIKLGFVIWFGGGLDTFPAEGTDTRFYHHSAMYWLQTGIYGTEQDAPTVGMPPGQPAFLALLYAVSKASFAFAKLAHIVLMTTVAALTFLTGMTLFGVRVGLLSGFLLAIDPAQAYLASTFLSEPLFMFLMALAFYALVRQRMGARWYWLATAGICLGLAALTRNQGWLFVLFLVAAAVLTRGRALRVRDALVLLGITGLVILPWTARNYLVNGGFVLVSAEGGLTLWASNNPEFEWRQPMPMSLEIYRRPEGLDAHGVDEYYRERALEWIRENPAQFLANGIRKIIVLYHFDPLSARAEMSDVFRLAGLIPYGLMLPFIFAGMLTQWRDERLWIFYCYIFFTTLVAFVFWGDSRIRAPIQPYLYLFGVLGARQMWHAYNARARWRTGSKV